MLWSSDSCQNKVSTQDHTAGSGIELIKAMHFEVVLFLKLATDQVFFVCLVFHWMIYM